MPWKDEGTSSSVAFVCQAKVRRDDFFGLRPHEVCSSTRRLPVVFLSILFTPRRRVACLCERVRCPRFCFLSLAPCVRLSICQSVRVSVCLPLYSFVSPPNVPQHSSMKDFAVLSFFVFSSFFGSPRKRRAACLYEKVPRPTVSFPNATYPSIHLSVSSCVCLSPLFISFPPQRRARHASMKKFAVLTFLQII